MPDTYCSFCGKLHSDVAKVIAGPGVFICNECVEVCNTILAEVGTAGPDAEQPRYPDWASMSDEDLLASTARMAKAGDQVDASLREWVGQLRSRGVTWARVGEALGMSRQSAWERFSGADPVA